MRLLLILAVLAIVVVGMLVFTAASRSPQTRNVGRRARRGGLGVFFVSVAVNAALGIYAVLTPDFGDTAGKILGTSLCVTGAILMALCCEPAWERRLLTPVPVVGALLGAAAFAGLIVGLWAEPESATLAKLLASTFAAAIACTLASVVVLERARNGISLGHKRAITLTLGVIALDAVAAVALIWTAASGETVVGDFIATGLVATAACILADLLTLFHPAPATRRVLVLALGLIALAATGAVALIWTAPSGDTVGKFAGTCGVAAVACALAAFLTHARLAPGHRRVLTATLALLLIGGVLFVADIWLDAWGLTRATGVTLIALAAFAVTVPVLHWLDRGAVGAAAATGGAIRYCPHCGRKLTGEVGVEARCAQCGRRFTVIDSDRRRTNAPVAPGRLSAERPAGRSPRSRKRKTVSKDVRAR
ncbi:MAG TPA: hypothetical protein VLD16_17025 [Gaiellaceae bacterium]|nr:hypothetical protein [Gaiellaceae bacterium]